MVFWESNGMKVAAWNKADYKKSNIVLHADMRTNLQDEYEQNWDPTFVINFMNDESIFHNNGTIVFLFDKNDLATLNDYSKGYGKWKKDW